MSRNYEELKAALAEKKAQEPAAPQVVAPAAPAQRKPGAFPSFTLPPPPEAKQEKTAAPPAPKVTRVKAPRQPTLPSISEVSAKVKSGAPEAQPGAAPTPPTQPDIVLPPDLQREIDWRKVYDAAGTEMRTLKKTASASLGMAEDELERLAHAQGVDLESINNAKIKGRLFGEVAQASRERGVLGFLPVDERLAVFRRTVEAVEKAQRGEASDSQIELVKSGADRGLSGGGAAVGGMVGTFAGGPIGAGVGAGVGSVLGAGGYLVPGTWTELPEVAKPGEYGYLASMILTEALQKDAKASSLYDLYGRGIATGNTQKYVEERAQDLRQRAGVGPDDPESFEKMRKFRRQALNELLAYKTIGQWTPAITMQDVQANEGAAAPGFFASLGPNVELIGINNRNQAVFRQESPLGVLFRAIDIPQEALVAKLEGRPAAEGVQTGANIFEAAVEHTKDSAPYAKYPAMAAGFLASIVFPDLLLAAGAAQKGAKLTKRIYDIRKNGAQSVKLLETIAKAREAKDFARAAEAEAELRRLVPGIADQLDRYDANAASLMEMVEPTTDIIDQDMAAVIGSQVPTAQKFAAERVNLHPSIRKQELAGKTLKRDVPLPGYAGLYDTEGLLKRVQDAKASYVNNAPKSLGEYVALYAAGTAKDVLRRAVSDGILTPTQLDEIAVIVAREAPLAVTDEAQFADNLRTALKAHPDFGQDKYNVVRQTLYTPGKDRLRGRLERKLLDIKGKSVADIQAPDIALFDRATAAIEKNSEARGVAASLLRDELAKTARIRVQPLNLFDDVAIKAGPDGTPVRLSSGGVLWLRQVRKAMPDQDFKEAYKTAALIDAMVVGDAKKRGVDPFDLYRALLPQIRRATADEVLRVTGRLPGAGAPPAPAAATAAAAAAAAPTVPLTAPARVAAPMATTAPTASTQAAAAVASSKFTAASGLSPHGAIAAKFVASLPVGMVEEDIADVARAKRILSDVSRNANDYFGAQGLQTGIFSATRDGSISRVVAVGDVRIVVDQPKVDDAFVIHVLVGDKAARIQAPQGLDPLAAMRSGVDEAEKMMDVRVKAGEPAIKGAPVLPAAPAMVPPRAVRPARIPAPAPTPAAVAPAPVVPAPAPAVERAVEAAPAAVETRRAAVEAEQQAVQARLRQRLAEDDATLQARLQERLRGALGPAEGAVEPVTEAQRLAAQERLTRLQSRLATEKAQTQAQVAAEAEARRIIQERLRPAAPTQAPAQVAAPAVTPVPAPVIERAVEGAAAATEVPPGAVAKVGEADFKRAESLEKAGFTDKLTGSPKALTHPDYPGYVFKFGAKEVEFARKYPSIVTSGVEATDKAGRTIGIMERVRPLNTVTPDEFIAAFRRDFPEIPEETVRGFLPTGPDDIGPMSDYFAFPLALRTAKNPSDVLDLMLSWQHPVTRKGVEVQPGRWKFATDPDAVVDTLRLLRDNEKFAQIAEMARTENALWSDIFRVDNMGLDAQGRIKILDVERAEDVFSPSAARGAPPRPVDDPAVQRVAQRILDAAAPPAAPAGRALETIVSPQMAETARRIEETGGALTRRLQDLGEQKRGALRRLAAASEDEVRAVEAELDDIMRQERVAQDQIDALRREGIREARPETAIRRAAEAPAFRAMVEPTTAAARVEEAVTAAPAQPSGITPTAAAPVVAAEMSEDLKKSLDAVKKLRSPKATDKLLSEIAASTLPPAEKVQVYESLGAKLEKLIDTEENAVKQSELEGLLSKTKDAEFRARGDAERALRESFAQAAPEKGRGLKQVGPAGQIKGVTELMADGRSIILLFEGADASTVLHEVAHIVRRNLLDQNDMDAITKWIASRGVKVGHQYGEFTGTPAEIEQAEELFAKAFEEYVRLGVAPNPSLADAFDTLKTVIANIYRGVSDPVIGANLQPEVRQVFDKLLSEVPEQANPTLKQVLRQQLLGGTEEDVGFLQILSKEAERRGIPKSSVADLEKQFETARSRGLGGSDTHVSFPVPVLGKKDWTLDELAELQSAREVEQAIAQGRKRGMLLSLESKARTTTAGPVPEETAVESLRSALAAVDTDTPMTAGAKSALRIVAATFIGGDVVGENGMRAFTPELRKAVATSVAVVEQSIGDTITLTNDALIVGDSKQVYRYLAGASDVVRANGRPIMSSGHDYMGSVRGMFQRAIAQLSDDEKVALTSLCDALNEKGQAREQALATLGFDASGETFKVADAARQKTQTDAVNAVYKILYSQTKAKDTEFGAALATALRDVVGAPATARPTHEMRLVEAMSYIAGNTARDGALFSGNSAKAAERFITDVGQIYQSEEVSRRVAVLIGGFGSAVLGKDVMVKLNLGISPEAYKAFTDWTAGAMWDQRYTEEIQRIVDRYGFNPEFVSDQVLGSNIYIPRAARERMAQALARAVYRPSSQVTGGDALNVTYRYMKTRMTRGSFFIRPRYYMMNTVDHFIQVGITEGFGVAAASVTRVLAQDLMVVPGWQQLVEAARKLPGGKAIPPDVLERVRRGLQRAGDRGAGHVGRLFGVAKYRIEVNPILDGLDGGFTVGGKVYRYRDIRDIAVQERVFASFDTRQLANAIEREGALFFQPTLKGTGGTLATSAAGTASDSVLARTKNFLADWQSTVSETAEAWSERERLGAMVSLMEAGYDPRTAARITVDALYDYSQSMTAADRSILVGIMFPFWAFQKNANQQVLNNIFSPWGAYRMMCIKRARERSADLLTEIIYNEVGGEYGIDVDSMPPEMQDSYYAVITRFEESYGDQGPPPEAKRAMRMLLAGRGRMVEGGKLVQLSPALEEARQRGQFADFQSFAAYAVARPSKSQRPTYMRDRIGVAIPFPRTEAVRMYYSMAGDDHSYMELFIPESSIEAGLKHLTQMTAAYTLIGAAPVDFLLGGKLTKQGLEEVKLARVLQPIADPARSPLVAPLIAGSLSDITAPRKVSKRLAGATEAIVTVHPFVGKMMDDLYGTTFIRIPAVADPYVIDPQTGVMKGLPEEEAARIRELQKQYPDAGVLRDQRYLIPGGAWATAFDNSPLGELNALLLRYEANPLERTMLRGEILSWARGALGLDIELVSPKATVGREEPEKLKSTREM